jgi:phosphonate transport system substrate-binding protein
MRSAKCLCRLGVLPLCLFLPAFFPSGGLSAEIPIYSLAVLPSVAPSLTRAQWEPFVERLSRETGLRFALRTYRRFADFEDDFSKGVPDLIFAHSVLMVEARRVKGYIPLVRGGQGLSALVFVRKDSPVKSIKDLSGGSIALVGAKNVCSILVRQDLTGGEGIRFRHHFAGGADKVANEVIFKRSSAGATLESAFAAEPPEKRDQLRIVYTTPPIAPHPLAAHPRVPGDVREAVTGAVLRMGADPGARAILKDARLADPQRADYDRDYAPLEKINYSVLSKEE